MILYNAKIHTCDLEFPTATAMEIQGDKIVSVGDYETIANVENIENKIDLKGKTILPLFFDEHAQLWKVGHSLTFNLDLRGVKSIVESTHCRSRVWSNI